MAKHYVVTVPKDYDPNAPPAPPLTTAEAEKELAIIAARHSKPVADVRSDFGTCGFYGELAERWNIDFYDACRLMRYCIAAQKPS